MDFPSKVPKLIPAACRAGMIRMMMMMMMMMIQAGTSLVLMDSTYETSTQIPRDVSIPVGY